MSRWRKDLERITFFWWVHCAYNSFQQAHIASRTWQSTTPLIYSCSQLAAQESSTCCSTRVMPRRGSWSSTATAPLQSQSWYHKLCHAYLQRYTNITVRDHLGPPAASSELCESTPHCTEILLLAQPRFSWLLCARSSTLGLDTCREVCWR